MTEHRDVVCPFCGLLCDDLVVETDGPSVNVTTNGCELSQKRFAEASSSAAPAARVRIAGKAESLDRAIARAAELLDAAALPLIAGLATDVNGAREAVRLAERCGGTLDHANSAALLSNINIVQTYSWVTGTFAEVRNRADCVLIVGERLFDLFPRLAERILAPPAALLPERLQQREFIFLGPERQEPLPAPLDKASITFIPVDKPALGACLGVLRAVLAGHTPSADMTASVPLTQLQGLAIRLRSAHYSVLIWSAADLDPPHRDPAIRQLAELTRLLNKTTRCVGLPLGGSNGDITANQVCTWQSGYPVRVGFAKGYPEFDASLHDARILIADGACDALLWVAALAPAFIPPASEAPTIVLGHPAMEFEHEPDVFIAVGIPGIDHSGHLYRGDTVVALPLRRLREARWPSAAQVLRQIYDRLEKATCSA